MCVEEKDGDNHNKADKDDDNHNKDDDDDA